MLRREPVYGGDNPLDQFVQLHVTLFANIQQRNEGINRYTNISLAATST